MSNKSSGYKSTKDLYVYFIHDCEMGHDKALYSINQVRAMTGRYQHPEGVEADVNTFLEEQEQIKKMIAEQNGEGENNAAGGEGVVEEAA